LEPESRSSAPAIAYAGKMTTYSRSSRMDTARCSASFRATSQRRRCCHVNPKVVRQDIPRAEAPQSRTARRLLQDTQSLESSQWRRCYQQPHSTRCPPNHQAQPSLPHFPWRHGLLCPPRPRCARIRLQQRLQRAAIPQGLTTCSRPNLSRGRCYTL
jgi:hypothetical protein